MRTGLKLKKHQYGKTPTLPVKNAKTKLGKELRKPEANEYQVGGSHYKGTKIEHWDLVVANGIPYLEAQIIKYVMRYKRKNGLEDLRKAQHYLVKLLEVETEKEQNER